MTVKKKKHTVRFSPKLEMGLGFSQIKQRERERNTNARIIDPSKSIFKIIAENVFQFCNVFTILIVIMLFCIGEYSDTFSSTIIFFNIAVGIIQGVKAKNAIKRLSFEVDSDFAVIRDGKRREIPVREIVLDDLVVMRAGSKVPVDGVIREGSLDLDESILTGEGNIVKKGVGDYVLSGSHVLVGEAVVQADKVGMHSNIQRIGKVVRRLAKPKSRIFYSLDFLIKIISFILVPLAIGSFLVNFYVAGSSLHVALKYTAASALAMLPVGMFFLTSCALAASVLKLSQKNTLVQDMYGVEMLALVDTLLLDKTGTITTGAMRVVDQKVLDTSVDHEKILSDLLAGTKDMNATANALRKLYGDGDPEAASFALPFYSGRKYGGVTFKDGSKYVLGAPEYVSPFTGDLKAYSEKCASEGKRVVVLSRLDGDLLFAKPELCTPILALAIEDEIRDDAPCTLKWFRENDVRIMVISGDDPLTVSRIATKAGVVDSDKFVNCSTLSDDELKAAVNDYAIFGRVSPEQKCLIVNELRRRGKTVGMVGDGVNDVHALKSSDCSISFGSANEVARSVAGIVLVDSKFSSLPAVVAEGRRVVSNIEQVASLYIMKNLFTMLMTAIFLCLGRLYPFSTSQMLMIEAFVLGIPALFLAMQRSTKVSDGNFIPNVLKRTYPATVSLLFSVLASYFLLCGVFSVPADMRSTIGALTLVSCGFVELIFNSLPLNKFRSAVIVGSFIAFLIAAFAVYGLNVVGLHYVSFEVKAIDGTAFGIICISVLFCTAMNFLFHYLLRKMHLGTKKNIPFYLESYYGEEDKEEEEGSELSDNSEE
ncbi:MAG: HAD-IC family P-type ATPase [Clostridia bacterium]|nr:HAD-IC family P-type ATPase [Clostridia bacterium]